LLAIADAVLVIVEQPAQRLLSESLAAEAVLGQQRLAQRLVQLLAEPSRHGHGEAPLSGSGALGREPFVRRVAQQPLAEAASQLHAVRQARAPLDELVIEERHAQ